MFLALKKSKPCKQARARPRAGMAWWSRASAGLHGPAATKNAPGGKKLPKKLQELQLHALAMAGPAAGWLEAALLKNEPNAYEAQKLLGEHWAARYPRPKEAGFGGGGELKAELLGLRSSVGPGRKPSSSWSPQGSAALGRARQAFGGILRALELGGAALGESEPLQNLLTGAACAGRGTYLAAQGAAPAQAALGGGMALPAGSSAGWGEAARRKQE